MSGPSAELRLLLQRDYWRAMYRRERAVRRQPVARAIRETSLANAALRRIRAEMRAHGVRP